MRITTEQLQQQLTREIRALYTVYGDETLLALEACDRVRAAARVQGYSEREVLTVDSGFRWSELHLAGSSQSLFASRKILELRIPTGKPGTEGSVALQSYCDAVPAETVTLVQLPAMDWRAQKSGWFEALDSAGVAVEARVVPRKSLPQWLAGRLKAQHQDADSDTLDFIADRVEGNLMAAYQEVQKLALLFPAGKLSFHEVREAVLDVARYDVFNLGEVMLEGDPVRLSRMLDGLKGEGAAPPLVLWALAEEIRAIGKVASGAAAGKPVHGLVREARIRGASHQSLMQANHGRYSAPQISEALRHAAAVDRMIKGLAKGDVWSELLQLALRFAKGNTAAVGARHSGGRSAPAGHAPLF
ncbi:MAG: polymerase subunit delta [Betaproteobacteria bacterium]|nr:polymerase subunit delta [Betaproteobacteria bacterium]